MAGAAARPVGKPAAATEHRPEEGRRKSSLLSLSVVPAVPALSPALSPFGINPNSFENSFIDNNLTSSQHTVSPVPALMCTLQALADAGLYALPASALPQKHQAAEVAGPVCRSGGAGHATDSSSHAPLPADRTTCSATAGKLAFTASNPWADLQGGGRRQVEGGEGVKLSSKPPSTCNLAELVTLARLAALAGASARPPAAGRPHRPQRDSPQTGSQRRTRVHTGATPYKCRAKTVPATHHHNTAGSAGRTGRLAPRSTDTAQVHWPVGQGLDGQSRHKAGRCTSKGSATWSRPVRVAGWAGRGSGHAVGAILGATSPGEGLSTWQVRFLSEAPRLPAAGLRPARLKDPPGRRRRIR